MFERSFEKLSPVPGPRHEVFDWHTRPGAFTRLTPPWDPTRLLHYEGIRDGQRVVLRVVAPWPRKWIALHSDYVEGVQFKDEQVKGPFPRWVHTHRVESDPVGRADHCVMHDQIDFKLPMGPLGALAYKLFMKRQIQRMFDHRHAILTGDIFDHRTLAGGRQLTVAITGASGLIGSALSDYLSTGGHEVRSVKRLDGLSFDIDAIAGCDALVHLAGEPIAQRWNDDVKEKIRRSRVDRTALLAEQLARLPESQRPSVMLSGSATGYYGDRGDAILTEDSHAGTGFLAGVAQAWERATRLAEDAGIRVVHLRTGIVLSPKGGALQKMLTPFKLGLGGRLGSGLHYMPWITLDDHIRAVYTAIFDQTIRGPLNLVAPQPVTNRTFTKTLAKVLGRPAILPAPVGALRLAFGEVADEALLASARVEPMKLREVGFDYRHPDLEEALRRLLGRD